MEVNIYLKDLTNFIFDLDGCVYFGDRINNGSVPLIDHLQKNGKQVMFLTNNSKDSNRNIAEKLKLLGIQTDHESVFSVTDMATDYITETYGSSNLFVIGSDQLIFTLYQNHNIVSIENNEQPDFVVCGLDMNFSYEKLYIATQYLNKGSKLIITNIDDNHNGSNGDLVPETGSLAAALISSANINEYDSIGKPNSFAFEYVIKKKHLIRNQTVMVGDNYYTDIVGAKQSSIYSCLLNTVLDVFDKQLIDFNFRDIEDMYKYIKHNGGNNNEK